MINVNNKNRMERQEQIIELSNHVKNKLKQHQYLSASSPFINSSDEFIVIDSTDDDSVRVTSADNVTRTRSDTYTTYQMKLPSESFFTDRNHNPNLNESVLQEKYDKQQQCQECIHRDRIIHFERQRLVRLYDENKKLHEQLRSSILLNHQYENDNEKLKYHLKKVNSHLYEYHINFDQLKQKIISEKKINPQIDEEKQVEDKQDTTIDHLKRLRYEVQMYNRIVAAKQKQEQQDELFN